MSFAQELASWTAASPFKGKVGDAPYVSSPAPSTERMRVPVDDGKPIIVTFLRHCGCPFAEATFIDLRAAAEKNPDIHFYAISHSSPSSTAAWLEAIGGAGTTNSVRIITDPDRELYAAWGLGTSSYWHVLSPSGLYAVYALGKKRDIWNRPTESGSRWQTAGSWAVDARGIVRWGGVARKADEVPDFGEAVLKVNGGAKL